MEKQRPAILEDLPSDPRTMVEALTARLTVRFPVGTDEQTLKSQLMDLGFQLDEDDVGQYAHYRTDSVASGDTYFVYWVLDAERQLTHIETDVHISRL